MGNYVFATDDAGRRRDARRRRRPRQRPRRRRDPRAHAERASPTSTTSRTNDIPGQDEHERGYWRDVGTLDAYYEANMDLLGAAAGRSASTTPSGRSTACSCRCRRPRSATAATARPPASTTACSARARSSPAAASRRSIIGPDVYIETGAEVTESIIFPGVRVGPGRPPAPLHHRQERHRARPATGSASMTGSTRRGFARSDQGVIVVEKDQVLG